MYNSQKPLGYLSIDTSFMQNNVIDYIHDRKDKDSIISSVFLLALAFAARGTDTLSLSGFRAAYKSAGLTNKAVDKVIYYCNGVLDISEDSITNTMVTESVKYRQKQAERGAKGGNKSASKRQIESSSSVGVLVTPRSNTDEINAAILASKGSYKPPIKE